MKTKVNYNAIESTITELNGLKTKLEEEFNNITNINSRLNNSWQGKAATNYQEKLTKLTNNFNPLIDEITNSIAYLQNILNNYRSADEAIKNALNSIMR